MSDIDRPRLVLYLALGLAVCLLGARYLVGQAASPAPAPIGAAARTGTDSSATHSVAGDGAAAGDGDAAGVALGRSDDGPITVDVAGAIRHAGVYRLPAGSRVDDAVRRAGGPTHDAELSALNLAAKLDDGRQVLVPQHAPAAGGAGAVPAPASAASDPQGAATGASAAPVNLNTATLEQLDTLDGVGPGIAQRILDYRQQHGGFSRVEELGEVPGIGPKRLAALTPRVAV
ncbi:MAG TPA: helix-hairpin-helix domain-containing protein [Solirubrobacteraceae bacterium]|nr:helix-hairpin-helix domain-containing protein [Solirubrobacteraceae bacterium]